MTIKKWKKILKNSITFKKNQKILETETKKTKTKILENKNNLRETKWNEKLEMDMADWIKISSITSCQITFGEMMDKRHHAIIDVP